METKLIEKFVESSERVTEILSKLKKTELPIVLYGAGEFAYSLEKYLNKNGIEVAGFFVSDDYLSYSHLIKKTIYSYSQMKSLYEKHYVLIACSDLDWANKSIFKKDNSHIEDVFLINCQIFDGFEGFDMNFIKKHIEEFEQVYNSLSDDYSRDVYVSVINSILTSDNSFLQDKWSNDQYFPSDIITINKNEVFVDGGAYIGDTLEPFNEISKSIYKKYYAVEPDKLNAIKLKELICEKQFKNVEVRDCGLWSRRDVLNFESAAIASAISETGNLQIEVDAIDILAPDATFIKMDVEGAEIEALMGAIKTIKNNKPKLAICIYHCKEHLYSVPLLIKEILPEYNLYLRQHHPYSKETVIYAIP